MPGTRAWSLQPPGNHIPYPQKVSKPERELRQDLALSKRTAVEPRSRCAAASLGRCLCSGDSGASLTTLGFAPASDQDFTLSLRQWSGSGLQPGLVPESDTGSGNP